MDSGFLACYFSFTCIACWVMDRMAAIVIIPSNQIALSFVEWTSCSIALVVAFDTCTYVLPF